MRRRKSIAWLWCLALGLVVTSAKGEEATDHCLVEVSGDSYEFAYIYAIRAHDPYDLDDTTRLTRLVCSDVALTPPLEANEEMLMTALMATPERGVLLEVRDNGEVVTVGLTWDGKDASWNGPFGGFSELTFEGANGPDGIDGSIRTKSKLEDTSSGLVLSVSVELRRAVDVLL